MTTAADVEICTSLEDARAEWTALAPGSGNVFSSWEWASTWWRHYGGTHRPLILLCREGRDVVAVVPLYLWSSRPLRVARFIGHGPADQLGPICEPAARARAAAALRDAATVSKLDLVLAELLPGDEEWPARLRERVLIAEASPTVSLDGGWDAYLARRSANFRQQLRRRERQLRSRHNVHFRLADDPARLQDDLTLLFALHRARWAGRSAFLQFEAFHREFAALALERGWLRLWFLELDGRPAAAWYGFRFARVESYYQAGRDPSRRDESLGFVLLAHSIRAAAEDRMCEYRLLRGDEPFKLRFAECDRGVGTCALARGTAGRAARLAVAAGLRSAVARSTARRLVRRLR